MKEIPMECRWCGKAFAILEKEFRRQARRGRNHFFCGLSCTAKYKNSITSKRVRSIRRQCQFCNREFTSNTGSKGAVFCSRSCASSGSVTDYRRKKAREMGLKNSKGGNFTIQSTAKGLRRREGAKYAPLAAFLVSIEERHQFEYVLDGKHVFDLALIDRKILVEFDGKDHNWTKQIQKDKMRDQYADSQGWTVSRIVVKSRKPIDPRILDSILA